ncbi:MAG TPA: group II intron maturase-specific domain-containing protein [Bryobacteraceae bacterium]|nr:group II intron maturase-specific domain-containing protein [Bryobacteraceae bacterium]
MQRWPSPRATKKLRDRVRELTGKRQSGQEVKQIVAKLTPVLRGWGTYFRTGIADREFNKMDYFVVTSLRRWSIGGVGNGQPNGLHSPAISYTECTRRKPHLEDHR